MPFIAKDVKAFNSRPFEEAFGMSIQSIGIFANIDMSHRFLYSFADVMLPVDVHIALQHLRDIRDQLHLRPMFNFLSKYNLSICKEGQIYSNRRRGIRW